ALSDYNQFVVQKGALERSFVRYLDWNVDPRQVSASTFANGARLQLLQFNLDGTGTGTQVSLSGVVTISGNHVLFDFGTAGLPDGYYRLRANVDGQGGYEVEFDFYVLRGDVTGDGLVTNTDVAFISDVAVGLLPPTNETDANGDGYTNGL